MPRIARKHERVRLNLDMPKPVRESLESLRDETHADSLSEVVRRALAVYEFLHKEKQEGATLLLRSEDGTERQLELL